MFYSATSLCGKILSLEEGRFVFFLMYVFAILRPALQHFMACSVSFKLSLGADLERILDCCTLLLSNPDNCMSRVVLVRLVLLWFVL